MKCYELFHAMSPSLSNELLNYLLEEQKQVYQAAINNLAPQQKLRPVFIQRKSKTEKNLWLTNTLSRRQNENIAANFLQLWLTAKHKNMLIEFLDSLKIEHDENGMVEEMPVAPTHETLQKAVDSLLEKYPAELVTVYLHAFLNADIKGWDELQKIILEDERLKFESA